MKTHEHTANIVKDESNDKTGKHSLTSLGFAEPHTILYKDTNIMRPANYPWHRNAAERLFLPVLSAQSEATAQLSATEGKGRLAQEKAVLRKTVETGYVNEMSQNSGKRPDNAV